MAKKKDWFSIKEAAKYLDVGEPTIYRWMRDGKMTFRKVGDSTRFYQEDLDAMIQVVPSQREVSQVKQQCPLCGNPDLVDGRLQSTGLNYFKPTKAKFWSLKDTNIKTDAKMCSRCGYVALIGDTEKLSEIREDIITTTDDVVPNDSSENEE